MAQDWFNALFGPYFERQGKLAKESAAFADEGAKSFREQGNPLGLGQMALGAAGWAASPLSAIVPHGIEQNSVVPEALKPAVKATTDFADYFMPGPNEFMAPAQAVLLPMALANSRQLKQLPEYTRLRDKLTGQAESQQDLSNAIQEVWQRTGWDQPSVDMVPRTELSDRGLRVAPIEDWRRNAGRQDLRLPDLIEHAELFKQVPAMRDINLLPNYFESTPDNTFVSGYYQPDYTSPGNIALTVPSTASVKDIIPSAAHEIQHALDTIGGTLPIANFRMDRKFSQAANPLEIRGDVDKAGLLDSVDPMQLYLAMGHESLARNVDSRLRATQGIPVAGRVADFASQYPSVFSPHLTDPNFANYAPSLTSPVPIEEQIYGYWRDDPLRGLTSAQRRGIKRQEPGDVYFK